MSAILCNAICRNFRSDKNGGFAVHLVETENRKKKSQSGIKYSVQNSVQKSSEKGYIEKILKKQWKKAIKLRKKNRNRAQKFQHFGKKTTRYHRVFLKNTVVNDHFKYGVSEMVSECQKVPSDLLNPQLPAWSSYSVGLCWIYRVINLRENTDILWKGYKLNGLCWISAQWVTLCPSWRSLK